MAAGRFVLQRAVEPTQTFLTWLVTQLKLALPGPTIAERGFVAGAITLDLSTADLTTCVLTGNVTVTLQAVPAGTTARVQFQQDGTGGRTVTIANATFPSGWTMSAGAGRKDLLEFTVTATTVLGRAVLTNYSA
jgi:hypothetical protein